LESQDQLATCFTYSSLKKREDFGISFCEFGQDWLLKCMFFIIATLILQLWLA
jgi:hypothetical protein